MALQVVVGEEEIRGDTWLQLDCGHLVRKEAYQERCDRCDHEEDQTPKPTRGRAQQRKSTRERFMPYDASSSSAPNSRRIVPSPPEEYPREWFTWRGKLRR